MGGGGCWHHATARTGHTFIFPEGQDLDVTLTIPEINPGIDDRINEAIDTQEMGEYSVADEYRAVANYLSRGNSVHEDVERHPGYGEGGQDQHHHDSKSLGLLVQFGNAGFLGSLV